MDALPAFVADEVLLAKDFETIRQHYQALKETRYWVSRSSFVQAASTAISATSFGSIMAHTGLSDLVVDVGTRPIILVATPTGRAASGVTVAFAFSMDGLVSNLTSSTDGDAITQIYPAQATVVMTKIVSPTPGTHTFRLAGKVVSGVNGASVGGNSKTFLLAMEL